MKGSCGGMEIEEFRKCIHILLFKFNFLEQFFLIFANMTLYHTFSLCHPSSSLGLCAGVGFVRHTLACLGGGIYSDGREE